MSDIESKPKDDLERATLITAAIPTATVAAGLWVSVIDRLPEERVLVLGWLVRASGRPISHMLVQRVRGVWRDKFDDAAEALGCRIAYWAELNAPIQLENPKKEVEK